MKYTRIDVVVENESAEIWQPCPSFQGYEASNFGRVRSVVERAVKMPIPVSQLGKDPLPPIRTILTQRMNPAGYSIVTLYPTKHPTIRMVHVLVLDAFIGPRPSGAMIQHIDGDKIHNAISNLRYIASLSVNGQPGGSATASAEYLPPEAVWVISERGAVRGYAETLEDLHAVIDNILNPPDPEDEVEFNFQ